MLENILEEISEIAEKINAENRLILYNDDVNTFDFVITSLIDICGHTDIQATQCAFIAHTKGRCIIKSGLKPILIPMQEELKSRNIIAEIQ